MKLYFDTCCYNRPYDGLSQVKIRMEGEAVQNIIKLAQWYGYTIFSSMALDEEIGEITDPEKRKNVLNLYRQSTTDRAYYRKSVFDTVKPIAATAGVKGTDIHHLAFAEAAGADYLLTTDKGFLKAAEKLDLSVKVINPLKFPLGGVI